MTELIRGQKVKLADLASGLAVEVGIRVSAPGGRALDISCFGLDADGKLTDDRYFIFYNQKLSPCGGLSARGPSGEDQQVFHVDLAKLPSTIRRLVFAATMDGGGSLADIGSSHLRVLTGATEVARFAFSGAAFGAEKAVMVAELYLKDVWRLAAVGQGFNGGLSALLAHFGGTETTAPPSVSIPAVAAQPPNAAAVVPPAIAAPVNLGKVTLEKRGAKQAVNLKKGGGSQPIHVNLNWDIPKAKVGFFGKLAAPAAPDLDLGCMFKLTNGKKGVIQPLGGNFGSKTSEPFIYLDKDDRSGASADGENLYLYRPDLVETVMIFAMIYEGTARFSDVNARLTLRDQSGAEIVIKLDNGEQTLRFCSVCLIERRGEKVEITKEERYFPGHQQADAQFGFGFSWTAGRK